MYVPEFCAFHRHIRFAQRERVNVGIRVEVCQAMINESMCALIASHGIYDVEERGICRETPVVLGDLRRGLVSPVQ